MATFAHVRCSFLPPVPQSFADLGIPETLVLDLMLRRMVIEGFSSMTALSRSIRVSLPIVDLVFKHMRQQQLVEIKGMSGNDYQFVLSQAGKQLAGERFQVSQYAGACPVSLPEYHAATKAQSARISVDRRLLRQAFSDLVVTDKMLDQMGPAIISQTSIFVYGPTGNGKTSLAERMLRVYQDAVMIPYAVEVDNQIISVYDPVVHQPIDHDDVDVDPRWILCKRPCIVVGGELIPSMLELRLDETSGIYAAPLQMKANNGILLIDDFGRQLMSPARPSESLDRTVRPARRLPYLAVRHQVSDSLRADGGFLHQPRTLRPGRRSLPAAYSQQDLRGGGGCQRFRPDLYARGGVAQHSIRGRQRRVPSQAMPARWPGRTARLLSG